MPSVVLATLDTAVLHLALISEAAPKREVEERATVRATVLEGGDLLPFSGWNSLIFGETLGALIKLGLRRLVLHSLLGLLQQSFVPSPSGTILPGLQ